jgi:hypothetical protein
VPTLDRSVSRFMQDLTSRPRDTKLLIKRGVEESSRNPVDVSPPSDLGGRLRCEVRPREIAHAGPLSF